EDLTAHGEISTLAQLLLECLHHHPERAGVGDKCSAFNVGAKQRLRFYLLTPQFNCSDANEGISPPLFHFERQLQTQKTAFPRRKNLSSLSISRRQRDAREFPLLTIHASRGKGHPYTARHGFCHSHKHFKVTATAHNPICSQAEGPCTSIDLEFVGG